MQRYSFRGVDRDLDHSLNYAKDRDRALAQLGPRACDSVIPGLSSNVQATAMQNDISFFDKLLTSDGKALASSQGIFMTKEVGLKYALDVAAASKAVELSSSNPYSFLDQRHLDRLTGNSMNSESRNKVTSTHTDNIYDSFLNLTNFDDLVLAASRGLHLYYSVTLESRKVVQEASKVAACNQTSLKSEDKKVWDQFMSYAHKRNIDPLEASVQDVQDWLTHRAQNTGAGPKVEHEL